MLGFPDLCSVLYTPREGGPGCPGFGASYSLDDADKHLAFDGGVWNPVLRHQEVLESRGLAKALSPPQAGSGDLGKSGMLMTN